MSGHTLEDATPSEIVLGRYWREIDSAPKGVPFMCAWKGLPGRGVAKWSDRWERFTVLWSSPTDAAEMQKAPDLWMPLPDAHAPH